jgi:hydroxymethylglutaryl-CoA lyase
VPAHLLPQLADTAELLAYAKTLPGLFASVLVPNLKGAERALAGGADLMVVPLSASHAHSLANLRKTPDEVVAEVGPHPRRARRGGLEDADRWGRGHGVRLHDPGPCRARRGAAPDAGAARCGRRPREPRRHGGLRRSRDGSQPVRARAAHRGRPPLVRAFPRHARPRARECYAALEVGITRFDACLAGIGGCPHAPGASGNVDTEDLVFMLESMGVATGVDLPKLLDLRQRVASWLDGETLQGTVWRAGFPKTFVPAAAAAAAEEVAA